VYDLDSNPSWELNVTLAMSQAGERWRIPQPAQYLHRNWDAILPPETPRKGKKRNLAGPGLPLANVDVHAALKIPRQEHSDESIEEVARECAESGDLTPLEGVLADIKRAKSCFMEMLAQRKADEGLRRQSARLSTISSPLWCLVTTHASSTLVNHSTLSRFPGTFLSTQRISRGQAIFKPILLLSIQQQ
jgi:hypothetical protein